MKAQKKPAGFVIYRGPSLLTGAPIVVVAITKSSNVKTGNMVQTYILVDNDQSPVANVKALNDEAICGSCPHRRGKGGACYVNLGQGPRSVAAALLRGNYPQDLNAAKQASAGRMVRLGTYGDPAAVPAYVWDEMVELASGHTGYSHQWKQGKAGHVMHLCMASADSEADRVIAKAMGFRTFRVRSEQEPIRQGEFVCPASKEANYKKTCATCGACSGGIDSKKADPAIIVHGSLKNRFIPIISA